MNEIYDILIGSAEVCAIEIIGIVIFKIVVKISDNYHERKKGKRNIDDRSETTLNRQLDRIEGNLKNQHGELENNLENHINKLSENILTGIESIKEDLNTINSSLSYIESKLNPNAEEVHYNKLRDRQEDIFKQVANILFITKDWEKLNVQNKKITESIINLQSRYDTLERDYEQLSQECENLKMENRNIERENNSLRQ